jgi:hypothetical protein
MQISPKIRAALLNNPNNSNPKCILARKFIFPPVNFCHSVRLTHGEFFQKIKISNQANLPFSLFRTQISLDFRILFISHEMSFM